MFIVKSPGVLYSTQVHCTVSRFIVKFPGVLYSSLVNYTVPRCILQCPGVLYSAHVYCTVPRCIVQFSGFFVQLPGYQVTIHNCTVVWFIVKCSGLLHSA